MALTNQPPVADAGSDYSIPPSTAFVLRGSATDPDGLAISPRRQTISTSGLSKQIEKLGKKDLGIQLAISLHAVDDDLRTELIPMNKASILPPTGAIITFFAI